MQPAFFDRLPEPARTPIEPVMQTDLIHAFGKLAEFAIKTAESVVATNESLSGLFRLVIVMASSSPEEKRNAQAKAETFEEHLEAQRTVLRSAREQIQAACANLEAAIQQAKQP